MENYKTKKVPYSERVVTIKDPYGKSVRRIVYFNTWSRRLVMKYKGKYVIVHKKGQRGYTTDKL